MALSDKITVDEDANYYIQNRGADILLAQEAGEAPQADNVNGTLIKPYEVAKYKANGGDLYLRAYNSNCSVNITSDKAQTGGAIWFDFNSEGFTGVDDAEAKTTTFGVIILNPQDLQQRLQKMENQLERQVFGLFLKTEILNSMWLI